LSTAERLADALLEQGAEAVAVVGSRATGDATEDSDLDLAVIGEGPHYRLEVHDGTLVSVGWAAADEQSRRLYDPHWLGTHVPGWRHAVVLRDPKGLAAGIKEEALKWGWVQVEFECDEWVAKTVTGLAEEVLKLLASLRGGDDLTAAAQRSTLALRLPSAMAIRCRILCGSENRLWGLVADELGSEWREAQSSAFGLEGGSFDESCRSARRLFELAGREVHDLLDEPQLGAVEYALRRAHDL
jgi:predicted nucleotidyltransferase